MTLAESLNAAGYSTCFIGKWHLGQSGENAANPLLNGFDVNVGGAYFGNPGGSNGGFFAGDDGMWANLPGLNTSGKYPSDTYLTDALSTQAEAYIESWAGSPFFLMMSQYVVHTPIQAPQALINKYTQKISTLQSQGVDLKDHDNATYAAMVEKTDDSLGRLLDRLEDPNGDGDTSDSIRENTVIVFASDNGGLWASEGSPTRNLPLREGKGSVYEGGIRGPFMVSWTGNQDIAKGVVTSARTSSHDIYPTLLEVAGVLGDLAIPQNEEIDGVSLLGVLEGRVFDRGYQYWHYPHVSPQHRHTALISGGAFVSAVRKDEWKLLFFYDDRHYELYNVANDVGETADVLAGNATIAEELSTALHEYLVVIEAQMPIHKQMLTSVAPPPILFELVGSSDHSGSIDSVDWGSFPFNLFSDVLSLSTSEASALGDIAFQKVAANGCDSKITRD